MKHVLWYIGWWRVIEKTCQRERVSKLAKSHKHDLRGSDTNDYDE